MRCLPPQMSVLQRTIGPYQRASTAWGSAAQSVPVAFARNRCKVIKPNIALPAAASSMCAERWALEQPRELGVQACSK